MPLLADRVRPWTFDRLQHALPDDGVDWRRFEILDGALVTSPSPDSWHESAVVAVRDEARATIPADYLAVGSLGIAMGSSYLIPDMVIARRRVIAARVALLNPRDVLLVVEVVSPSSRTLDRITKPAQYAAAGIPGYWRVETDPLPALSAYALPAGADTYVELGTWGPGRTAQIGQPFPARIVIDALVPTA